MGKKSVVPEAAASPAVMDKIELVPIGEVKPFEKNAKRHKKKDIERLAAHIQTVGWDQPIVVVGETGEIIKGHKRRAAAVLLGMTQVPVFKVFGLNEVQIEERRLADNKLSESPWDANVLRERIRFLMERGSHIQSIGFDDLAKQIRNMPTTPEVRFTEVIGEANNYIVLTFDNEIDWLSAQTHFDLTPARARQMKPNEKTKQVGIGRVIDGAEYLRRIIGTN